VPRTYRLGRRQAAVDRTAASILTAARQLIAEGGAERATVVAIARRAGVSRLTVYQRFGSRAAVLEAVAARPAATPGLDLRRYLEETTAAWAADPALFRNLPSRAGPADDAPRQIAELLAAHDGLRPGCSVKEAEDVILALSAFPTFDRLYKDGRRSTGAVTEILLRLAGGILA